MTRVILLLLLLLVWQTHAIKSSSTFLNTFLANGSQGTETQWQQNSATVECSNTDFRDTSWEQAGLFNDVECIEPKYFFDVILRFFVPHKIRRYVAEVCEETQGTNTTDLELRNQIAVEVDIHNRRLFSFLENVFGSPSSWFSTSSCDHHVSPIGPIEAYRLFSHDTCGSASAGAAPNPNVILQQTRMLELLRKWVQQQQVVNAATSVADTAMLQALNISEAGLRKQHEILLNINETIGVVAQQTDLKFAGIEAQYGQFVVQQQQSLAGQATLNNREQLFENVTFANFASVADAFRQLAANASDDFYVALDGILKSVQQTRWLGLGKAAKLSKPDERRALTSQIFQLATQAITDGLTLFWDPSQAGQAPAPAATLTPDKRTVFVDIQYVNFINGTSPIVHQVEIAYYCNVGFVLSSLFTQPSWMDILTQIGPAGCTTLPGNTVDNCDCWVQVNHRQCPANTAGNDGTARDFNWQQIGLPSDTTNLNAYLLQANPSYCLGFGGSRTTAGPWDGQLIDQLPVWSALLSQLCNVQLSVPTLGTGGSGPRHMQMVSTRIGVLLSLDQPSNPTDTCLPNYDYIFKVATPENNVVFVIYSNLMRAQDLLLSDGKHYEALVYGVLPNYITYEERPFQMLSNNRTYACHRASFIAISDDTRPVFEIVPRAIATEISIKSYTTPPACDNTGCIFGNLAASQDATSGVVASVPFDFLLPDGSDGVVGEWRTHGIPTMTKIADMPTGATPINNVDADRRGTATYVWQPIPAGYSIAAQQSFDDALPASAGGPWPDSSLLDSWNALNAITFNSYDASISVDTTEREFVNGQAQVDAEQSHPLEWAGLMFQHFKLDPLTDMRNGRLVLAPLEWQYTGTLNIPAGEILQRVFPGCPNFAFISYTNGYQELFLTNSLPSQVDVRVSFTLDPLFCPPIGDMRFVLQPAQVQRQIIFGCPTATVDVHVVAAGGVLKTCEGTRNISYVPGAPGNIPYFTDDTTTAPVLASAVVDAAIKAKQHELDILQSLIPFIVPGFAPTLTVLDRLTSIDSIFSQENATLHDLAAAAKRNLLAPTITSAIAQLIAQFNAAQNEETAIHVQQAAADARVRDAVDELQAEVAIQGNLTVQLGAAIIEEEKADQANLDELLRSRRGSSGSHAECSWCTDFLDPPPPALDLTSPTAILSNVAAPVRSGVGALICPWLCSFLKILLVVAIIACFVCCCIQCGPSIIKSCCCPS